MGKAEEKRVYREVSKEWGTCHFDEASAPPQSGGYASSKIFFTIFFARDPFFF
jgi:hypothetical protein